MERSGTINTIDMVEEYEKEKIYKEKIKFLENEIKEWKQLYYYEIERNKKL